MPVHNSIIELIAHRAEKRVKDQIGIMPQVGLSAQLLSHTAQQHKRQAGYK